MYWTSRSIRLFRQDLEDLVALFGKIDENSTTILSGEHGKTYESFEDMKNKEGSDISTIVLRNPAIGVEVRLSSSIAGIALDTMKGTEEAELAFYKAKEFLEAHRRRSGEIVGSIPYWVWPVAGVLFFESFRSHSDTWGAIIAICLLSSIGIAVGSGKLGKRLSYMVTLDRKHERPTFFRRNKDQLILLIVTSILSAALGILATLFVQYLSKK